MPAQDSSVATPPSSPTIDAQRLIVVTNRGPVEYNLTDDKKLEYKRGAGGVVTALLGAVKQMEATWVSLAMTDGDRMALQGAENGVLDSPLPDLPMQLHYVDVPQEVYHNHYNLMSNQTLWFLQHYLDHHNQALSPQELQDAWEHGYNQANQMLADAVCQEIGRGHDATVVMIHDYHLYMVPNMIRKQYPEIVIQHFIHIPWPEIRYWDSAIPSQIVRSIFEGLLGNDIIGFQTKRDAQNFLDGVRAIFEESVVDSERGAISLNGRLTQVRDYPISISVTDERKILESPEAQKAEAKIKPLLHTYTIMRVDRIEPTKNIVNGFLAYDNLLEKHPELHGNVTFLACLIPSREDLATYQEYKDEVTKTYAEINQKYGNANWQPVQVFIQNDRTQALVGMQYYNVLLVNSLFDGMNLVAKEGAVVNNVNGLLVLSRTSGAFQQMETACIPVSPNDVLGTAEALYTALTMPEEERKQIAERARQEVERNDLNAWIVAQISDINKQLAKRRGS